jgi:PAP2 superfamily
MDWTRRRQARFGRTPVDLTELAARGSDITSTARGGRVAETRAERRFALLPDRVVAVRPPRWWQEIGFILIIYFLYSLVRDAVPSHETGAFHHARTVLSIERATHLNIEHSLNKFVAHHAWLAYTANYYYSTLHFVVTIGVLIWLYVKHPMRYRAIRTVLIITNLLALIGFWFISVAPPRLLHGYVDTLVRFHTWGSLASPAVASVSNQFAAMPSLHIGWSMWCAFAIVSLAKRRWVRVLGALYPVATFLVIVGTANHYVLDAIGGAVTLGIAIGIQRLLSGRPAFARPPTAAADAEPDRLLISA